MNKRCAYLATCLLHGCGILFAQTLFAQQSPSTFDASVMTMPGEPAIESDVVPVSDEMVPNCLCYGGFFAGIGGSYNSVRLDQDFNASSDAAVFSGTTLVASGEAGGHAAFAYHDTLATLAPMAQVGYVQNFGESQWLWGTKFSYKFLLLRFAQEPIDIPRVGILTNTASAPVDTTYNAHVVTGSFQTSVDHELALIPFLGHSFDRGRVYLGAGPVVFGTESRISWSEGLYERQRRRVGRHRQACQFSQSHLDVGRCGEIGLMYALGPSCVLDISYDFMATEAYRRHYSGPYSSASAGYTESGTLSVSTFQRLTAQSFNISLVKVF